MLRFVDRMGLLAALERDGLLLLADATLPSVAALVAGGPIRGSWWGHPRGGDIYRLSNELAASQDVLMAKLISGKVTFVHRRLWPAVVALGSARESWQTEGLEETDLTLLGMIDETGKLAWDDVPPFLPPSGGRTTGSIRRLEVRLLIHANELHTPTGAHGKDLETWAGWASSVGLVAPLPSPAEARAQLETMVDALNDRHAARGRLPWSSPRRRQVLTPQT